MQRELMGTYDELRNAKARLAQKLMTLSDMEQTRPVNCLEPPDIFPDDVSNDQHCSPDVGTVNNGYSLDSCQQLGGQSILDTPEYRSCIRQSLVTPGTSDGCVFEVTAPLCPVLAADLPQGNDVFSSVSAFPGGDSPRHCARGDLQVEAFTDMQDVSTKVGVLTDSGACNLSQTWPMLMPRAAKHAHCECEPQSNSDESIKHRLSKCEAHLANALNDVAEREAKIAALESSLADRGSALSREHAALITASEVMQQELEGLRDQLHQKDTRIKELEATLSILTGPHQTSGEAQEDQAAQVDHVRTPPALTKQAPDIFSQDLGSAVQASKQKSPTALETQKDSNRHCSPKTKVPALDLGALQGAKRNEAIAQVPPWPNPPKDAVKPTREYTAAARFPTPRVIGTAASMQCKAQLQGQKCGSTAGTRSVTEASSTQFERGGGRSSIDSCASRAGKDRTDHPEVLAENACTESARSVAAGPMWSGDRSCANSSSVCSPSWLTRSFDGHGPEYGRGPGSYILVTEPLATSMQSPHYGHSVAASSADSLCELLETAMVPTTETSCTKAVDTDGHPLKTTAGPQVSKCVKLVAEGIEPVAFESPVSQQPNGMSPERSRDMLQVVAQSAEKREQVASSVLRQLDELEEIVVNSSCWSTGPCLHVAATPSVSQASRATSSVQIAGAVSVATCSLSSCQSPRQRQVVRRFQQEISPARTRSRLQSPTPPETTSQCRSRVECNSPGRNGLAMTRSQSESRLRGRPVATSGTPGASSQGCTYAVAAQVEPWSYGAGHPMNVSGSRSTAILRAQRPNTVQPTSTHATWSSAAGGCRTTTPQVSPVSVAPVQQSSGAWALPATPCRQASPQPNARSSPARRIVRQQ